MHRTHHSKATDHEKDGVPSSTYIPQQLKLWHNDCDPVTNEKMFLSITLTNLLLKMFPTLPRCTNGSHNHTPQSNWITLNSLLKGLRVGVTVRCCNIKMSFTIKFGICEFSCNVLAANIDNMWETPATRQASYIRSLINNTHDTIIFKMKDNIRFIEQVHEFSHECCVILCIVKCPMTTLEICQNNLIESCGHIPLL